MIQLASLPLQPPRISSNQVAKYVFSSRQTRLKILHDQKFPEPGRVSYYQPAQCAILRSLRNNVFDPSLLSSEWAKIEPSNPDSKYHQDKCRNNKSAVESFIAFCHEANPYEGDHHKVQKNAKLILEGVEVSIRPELITDHGDRSGFSLTKLRFSKSKASLDESEIILLLLLKYGQQLHKEQLILDVQHTKLIDCFSKKTILGHSISRYRYQQLHDALKEIHSLWPHIRDKGDSWLS